MRRAAHMAIQELRGMGKAGIYARWDMTEGKGGCGRRREGEFCHSFLLAHLTFCQV